MSGGHTRKRNLSVTLIAIAGVLILLAIAVLSFLYNTESRFPKSGLDSQSGPVCYTSGGIGNMSFPKESPFPKYTEQLSLSFNQELNSLLQYNVSAIQQNESYGNGPTYTLDGRTDTNFWYQVGLSWSPLNGNLTLLGRPQFVFFYEVWNISSSKSIFPESGLGGGMNFSGPINQRDTLLLSLRIFNNSAANNESNRVVMSVYDWNTGASANVSYSGQDATKFVSAPLSSFTSDLTTEWYVTSPQFCAGEKVVYSNSLVGLKSVEMCIDEVEFSPYTVIYNGCSGLMTFKGSSYLSFSFMGHTVYSTPYEFVTT